jgi:hypothetical protein
LGIPIGILCLSAKISSKRRLVLLNLGYSIEDTSRGVLVVVIISQFASL